ncbi:MAG: chromosomal replication initiator protein DnaA [Gemmatimonadaceae bacterium]|nr:chromosomal replication initiator protein DnaA [Gemmatimonadaceae bacterium]
MSLSPTDVWSRLLDRARTELPDHIVETWLSPLTPAEFSGEALTLNAPDQFSVEWNERKHQALLESLAPVALGQPLKIALRVQQERLQRSQMDLFVPERGQERATIEPEKAPENVTLSSLNDRYSFDTFVIGKSNDLAAAAAMAVAQAPGKTYNPLFFYGPTGLGKTHLMQAIAHDILKRAPQTRVTYITTEQFTNDVITSIGKGAMHDFRRRYRETDLFLVDDVHFIGGKNSTQEEFFHTFNALYEAGRQIVLTSDRPPSEIPKLEARLASRFAWGMVADIGQPDLEHRIAILRRKAEQDHLEHTIPDDVLHFIADHVQSNVRELEGSIIKLLAYASLKHRVVTVDLAREALRDKLRAPDGPPVRPERQSRMALIQQRVASEWGVTVEGLQSKTRTKTLTIPRQVAMYLAREILGLQLVEIGQAFGGRDHSTVIHSLERVAETMKESAEFRNRVDRVRETVRHST